MSNSLGTGSGSKREFESGTAQEGNNLKRSKLEQSILPSNFFDRKGEDGVNEYEWEAFQEILQQKAETQTQQVNGSTVQDNADEEDEVDIVNWDDEELNVQQRVENQQKRQKYLETLKQQRLNSVSTKSHNNAITATDETEENAADESDSENWRKRAL